MLYACPFNSKIHTVPSSTDLILEISGEIGAEIGRRTGETGDSNSRGRLASVCSQHLPGETNVIEGETKKSGA